MDPCWGQAGDAAAAGPQTGGASAMKHRLLDAIQSRPSAARDECQNGSGALLDMLISLPPPTNRCPLCLRLPFLHVPLRADFRHPADLGPAEACWTSMECPRCSHLWLVFGLCRAMVSQIASRCLKSSCRLVWLLSREALPHGETDVMFAFKTFSVADLGLHGLQP